MYWCNVGMIKDRLFVFLISASWFWVSKNSVHNFE